MKRKIQVLLVAKGKDFAEKIQNITKKCSDLSAAYPCFGWEFFKGPSGNLYFTAYYREENWKEEFEFPIHNIRVDEKYKYIVDQLEGLKGSALRYEKE